MTKSFNRLARLRNDHLMSSVRLPAPPRAEDARIAACRAGDREALGHVFREHAPMLEGLIARLVGRIPEVEDLLQETFIQMVRAFPRYRGDASVKTWVYRIAVNVSRAYLRKPSRRRTVSLEVIPGGAEPIDLKPGADVVAARQQLVDMLYRHLGQLPAAQRIALVLHVVEEKSLAEVAGLMGASLTATKSRVFWARKRILARIQKDAALRPLLTEADL